MNNQQESNPYQYHADLILLAMLGLMFFSSIATIFWGADRCLGLGDEGVYLLAARYPDEIQQNVSSVYIYTGYLFQLANFDPVGFRLLGAMLVCLSAFVFWLGFNKFLFEFYPKAKTVKYFRSYSLFFIELGALLLYQWFYMTPNYNTLIGVAISISAGSILWGFAQTGNWQKNIKPIFFAFAFGGLSIGLALFTKLPAGVSFLALFLLVIVLWNGINPHQKIILIAAVLAGVSAWVLGHFLLIQPPQTWWQMFKEGWSLYQAYGQYNPQSKFIAYPKDLFYFAYSAIKIYWPCYLILFIIYPFYILRKKNREFSEITNSLTIFVVMLGAALLSVRAGVLIGERGPTDGSIPFYLVFHFAWILLLLTVWIFNLLYKSKHGDPYPPKNNVSMNIMLVLGLLVALPIAGSVGTSNPLYSVPLCHAATWFGAILLVLVFITASERDNFRLRLFGVLSIGAFTASQIIQGYIFAPQLIPTNLLQQVEATAVGFPAKTLKLDMQTHELVQELSSIAKANGFQPGGDIIAISFIPGLVYAMGGKSPGHPTFLIGRQGAVDYSRLALQYANINRLRNAFVLLNVEPAYVEYLLTSRGLDFPNGYAEVGTVVSRRVKYSLWKPVNAIKD